MIDHRKQVFEGPWLDRLFPIQLPVGRAGSVTGFSVLPTNTGILEGGLTREFNASQRRKILMLAEERYGAPVIVLEPEVTPMPDGWSRSRERYPWMACIARLTSAPFDPDMVSSELTLVWWRDAFEAPLTTEIEKAAGCIDWGRSAVDVDLP